MKNVYLIIYMLYLSNQLFSQNNHIYGDTIKIYSVTYGHELIN